MSLQGKSSSPAELDVVALASIKEDVTETLSLSTVGLNSINDETELRDEVLQPVDTALDGGTRDEAEDVVVAEEEDGIREDVSVAPSLAQSLAPSLASIKTVTDAVAAAAIQCIAPTTTVDEPYRASDQSVASHSKSVTAKGVAAGDFDDEKSRASSGWTWTKPPAGATTQDASFQSPSVSVSRSRSSSSKNSKLSNASKSSKSSLRKEESHPVKVVEAPVQSMVVPVARSGSSSIKSSKSSKSNHSARSNRSTKSRSKSPNEQQQPLMEDTSCSGQISKTSQQTTTSKTSIGGIVIEGHLVTVVPMRSPVAEDIEVNTKELKKKKKKEEEEEANKQKQKKKKKGNFKKVIFFPLSKKSKTKKKSELNTPNNRSTKKGGWLKKLTQRKKKQPRDTNSSAVKKQKSSADTESKDVISTWYEGDDKRFFNQVKVDVVVPSQSVQEEGPKIDSAEAAQIVTKASTVESEKEVVVTNASQKEVLMNTSTESEILAVKNGVAKGFDCGWDNGWFNFPAKAQQEEEVAAESNKADAVGEAPSEEEKEDDDKQVVMNASTENDVAMGFDCRAPSAMWEKVNGWIRPMSADESLYGSADVAAVKTEEASEAKEVEMKESPKEAKVSMCNIEEAQAVMCSIEEIKARWFGAPEEPKPSLDEELAADINQAVYLLNAQRALIKETEEAIKAEEEIIQGAENVQDFQAAEENKARLQRELTQAQRLEMAAKELVHHLFNSLTPEARLEAIRLNDDIAKADLEVSEEDEIDCGLCLDPYIHDVKEEYGDIFECDDNVILRSNSNASSKVIKIDRIPSASSKSSIKEDALVVV